MLWAAFMAVHGLVAALNHPEVSTAFGDVRGVYPWWVWRAEQGDVVGIDEPWVYPILAWLPIAASAVAGAAALPGTWLVVVTVLDGIAFWLLLRHPRGVAPAWTWLALMALLGPIVVGRIDSITMPIAIAGVVATWSGRHALAALAFTVGAWTKIWPGVLWIAQLVVRPGRLVTLAVGAGVTAVVMLTALALGSGGNVLSFLTWQGERGLQIEAVLATPFHWAGAPLGYDDVQLTYELQTEAADAVAAVATPVLVVVTLLVAALGVLAVRRGVDRDAAGAWLATAMVAALIVTNPVGSPQFAIWLIAPALLLVGIRAWEGVAVIVVLCGLTQLCYPWLYGEVVGQEAIGLLVLTLRNAGYVVLLALAAWRLVRLPRQVAPAR
ncbi:glycosyltransferase 87 family protein [Agrococcus jejuensis]|uniref:glycosyltransferase 87 family protein n=1 Tax=Agrococcus jejuensis TaxID=399736 RepID=UPI0011AAA491|nr:glycosyltransferase 87 family protein [Agrococcus jejuensis]